MTNLDDDGANDGAGGDVFATIRAVLNESDPLGVTDPDRGWPAHWCERCGGADGGGDDALVSMIGPRGGIVRVHRVCGELCRATLTPPCAGAPDGCGAPAGRPCAPGCPGTAVDRPATNSPATDPPAHPGPTRR